MRHSTIPRIMALLLVIALVVVCIILACKPARAAGQQIVDWPELPWTSC